MNFICRPLVLWPGVPTKTRQRAPFKSTYERTLQLLDFELTKLGASHVVLEIGLPESKIRMDGRPYSDALIQDPRIILAFDSQHGPLRYPCDRYDRWQSNLHAIALALEALRAVDRYGVTQRAEQYRGWAQLPPPLITEPPLSAEEAAQVLAPFAPGGKVTRDNLADAYRLAARQTHPDRGGSAEKFKKVQRAKTTLERVFGA